MKIQVFLVLAGLLSSALIADAAKMNVLVIVSDDMRNELGCYASRLAKTPHLDRLAATGVRFDRAYCQFPLCGPSRASMLTGRYPKTIGVLGNRVWFGDRHPGVVSLPRHFKNHGYTSIRVGKIFHGGIDDTEAWTHGGQIRTLAGVPKDVPHLAAGADPGDLEKVVSPEVRDRVSDRRVVLEGNGEAHADYQAADRAIRYLRTHKDETFFLGCGFSKPHSPLEAPQAFFDLWKVDEIPLPEDFAPRPTLPAGFPGGSIRPKNADLFIGRDASPHEAREMIRAYLAASAFMDWNVGRVLGELDALGLREKTIIVFWGDHGYQLGEKGKWSKAGSLWEQGARTPFFICDPRQKTAGQACERVVEMIDLYPTLVELCGLEPPAGLEGKSLVPLLREPAHEWNRPAHTIWSEDGQTLSGVLVRDERWRYAKFFGRGAGQFLIDPARDPSEIENLADLPAHSATVETFSRLAAEHARGYRVAPVTDGP